MSDVTIDDTVECDACGATADVSEVAPSENPLPDGWSEVEEPADFGTQTVFQCSDCSEEDDE